MLTGMIKNWEVLIHPVAICQSFGLSFYLRCLYHVILSPRRRTFIELLDVKHEQGSDY